MYLYRYEAKGIQEFILQSGKLRDMQGASSLIEDLSAKATLPAGGEKIFAKAGIGLFEFRSFDALCEFAAEWPMKVEQAVPGLILSTGWAPGADGAALTAVIKELEAARNCPMPQLPEAGPLLVRSGRTGKPAIKKDEDKRYLDAASVKMRKAAESGRDPLKDGFGLKDQELSSDLKHWPEGYAAVVHIDGNRIGKQIKARKEPKALKEFSEKLTKATETAAKAGAQAALHAAQDLYRRSPKEEQFQFPFRPIVLGGDDVTVLMHAALAIPFVRAYLRSFEEATRTTMSEALTACSGIAFVKTTFPFAQAHDLAEDLCKGAKKGLKNGDDTRSGLLFHRVTTSLLREWDDIRDVELKKVLAFGPYDEDTLNKLSVLVQAIENDGIGRGALREWVTLKRESNPRAAARWERLETITRQQSPHAWDKLQKALADLGATSQGCNKDGKTPVYDALTLSALGMGIL